jgi:hypothetical protein
MFELASRKSLIWLDFIGEPSGTRTRDPVIKSPFKPTDPNKPKQEKAKFSGLFCTILCTDLFWFVASSRTKARTNSMRVTVIQSVSLAEECPYVTEPVCRSAAGMG